MIRQALKVFKETCHGKQECFVTPDILQCPGTVDLDYYCMGANGEKIVDADIDVTANTENDDLNMDGDINISSNITTDNNDMDMDMDDEEPKKRTKKGFDYITFVMVPLFVILIIAVAVYAYYNMSVSGVTYSDTSSGFTDTSSAQSLNTKLSPQTSVDKLVKE